MTKYVPVPSTSTPRRYAEIVAERDAVRAEVAPLAAEAQALSDKIARQGGDPKPGDVERLRRLQVAVANRGAEMDALDAEHRALLGQMARDPRPGSVVGPFQPNPLPTRPDGPTGYLRSEASRTIDGLFRRGALPAHGAEAATELLTQGTAYDQSLAARWAIAAGADAYASAFGKLLGDPDKGHLLWTPQEQDAYRAVAAVQDELRAAGMVEGTPGAGGYMVPAHLDPAILLSNAGTTNAMRKVSRIVRTTTNAWNGVTSAGVVAEWPGEATQVADLTPALTPIAIPVFLGDAFVRYSFALADDVVGFPGELQKILLDAADNLQATAYTTGNGTTAPKGIITALTGGASEINGTGSEAIVAADLLLLQGSLPARFSPNAMFMAHIGIINTMSALETPNGALRFPEIANGRLLNRDLVENSDMDSVINAAATENNYVVVYGDFREYIIADRIGSTLEIVPNLMGANHRPTGERGALLWFRTGGNVSTINAFRLLDVPTTA